MGVGASNRPVDQEFGRRSRPRAEHTYRLAKENYSTALSENRRPCSLEVTEAPLPWRDQPSAIAGALPAPLVPLPAAGQTGPAGAEGSAELRTDPVREAAHSVVWGFHSWDIPGTAILYFTEL